MRQRSWEDIDTAQFYFVLKWPNFTIVSPKPKKAYTLSPSCLTWGTYAFVGPNAVNCPLYFTSTRMFRVRPSVLSQKTFNFTIRKPLGWDTSQSFLIKQITCLIGEDLLTNNSVRSFVDDLYKIACLKPDPVGEFDWNSTKREKEKGFGIVEFALSVPEITYS